MRQLVHDHVVDHIHGSHDQAPGEADGASCATRTPAPLGAGDAQSGEAHADQGRVVMDAFSKKLACPGTVPLLEDYFSSVERRHVQTEPRLLVEGQGRFLESDNYEWPFASQVREAFSRQEVVTRQQGHMAAGLGKL